LKALFQLESTIAADNGSAFQPGSGNSGGFNRFATVGLQSASFGTVLLGRQTSVIKDAYDQIDPFGDGGTVGAISNIFFAGTLNGDLGRVSNSIKYTSNSFAGFKANVHYAFGETAGDTGANSNYGLGLGYANGPLNVQFGYHAQDLSTTLVTNPVQTGKNKLAFLGATYDFGVVKLHGAYADTKKETFGPATETKFRNYMIGLSAPVGPGTIFGSYSVIDNRTTDNADSKKIALMYSYDLSKRTNLYTGYSRTSNDDGVLSTSGYGGLAGYNNQNGVAPAGLAGETTSVFTVGIRHKF